MVVEKIRTSALKFHITVVESLIVTVLHVFQCRPTKASAKGEDAMGWGGGGEGHVSAMVRFDTVPRLALGMSGGMDSGRSGPTCLLC